MCGSYQWLSNLKCASKLPGGPLKTQVAGLQPSFLVHKGQGGAENIEPSKFPNAAAAAEDGL